MVVPLSAMSLTSQAALVISCCGKPSRIQLVREHLPEGCQWEGVALCPTVHLQDQLWTLGLLVSFMSTVMNNSSLMTSWMTSWHHWRSAQQSLSHHLLGQSWCCILFWFLYCSHADVRMVKGLAASSCPLLRLSAWTYRSWAQGLSFPYECILTCKQGMFLEHGCHHSSYMCLS